MNVTRFADWDLKSIILFGLVPEKNPDCFSADKMKKKMCRCSEHLCIHFLFFHLFTTHPSVWRECKAESL